MKHSHRHQPWADVAVFENLADAHVVVRNLKNCGFPARAYDDKVYRHFLFLCPPRVTYRLQVRREDTALVAKLLETKYPGALGRSIHCPDCGSREINYPQMTRRFILPTVLLHLGIIFRIVHHEAYCESCHYTWELAPVEKPVVPQLKASGH